MAESRFRIRQEAGARRHQRPRPPPARRRSAQSRRLESSSSPDVRPRARPRPRSGRKSGTARGTEAARGGLIEPAALRRRRSRPRPAAAVSLFQSGQTDSTARKMGSGLSSMPSPPPNGRSSTVRWRSKVQVAQIMDADGDQARLDGLCNDTVFEGTAEELGKDGQDMEGHGALSRRVLRAGRRDAFERRSIWVQMDRAKGMSMVACLDADLEQHRPAGVVPSFDGAEGLTAVLVDDAAAEEVGRGSTRRSRARYARSGAI